MWNDLLSDQQLTLTNGRLSIDLEPYAVVWLTPSAEKA